MVLTFPDFIRLSKRTHLSTASHHDRQSKLITIRYSSDREGTIGTELDQSVKSPFSYRWWRIRGVLVRVTAACEVGCALSSGRLRLQSSDDLAI